MVKSKNQKRGTNRNAIRYSGGKPTRNGKASVGFAMSQGDMEEVHSITNPFCASARGAKLPDSDSTRSVPVSIVARHSATSDANGKLVIRVKPSLAEAFSDATTITGEVVTELAAATPVHDNTALAAQFDSYRIVSFGVKVYSTLVPTAQSGYFTVLTNPRFGNGINAASAFYEETTSYPTTEQTVQWISKPVGNAYLDYVDIAEDHSWDHFLVFGSGLPLSTSACLIVEVFFNLECQVKLSGISAAISSPAAPHKPHILAAAGHTLAKAGGSKLAAAAKAGFMSWIKGALARGADIGMRYLTGGKAGVSQISNFAHVPLVD